MTEALYNTSPPSVNTGKDGSTAHENERSHPSTSTSDIATRATPSTASRAAYGGNNTTKRTNDTVDNLTTSTVNVTHKPPTMKELEVKFFDNICSTSCADKCDEQQWSGECYCDRACVQLGDCCLDYEASCLSGPSVTRNNYADIVRSRKPQAAKCVDIPLEEKREQLLIVSSCGGVTSTDTATVDLCERPSLMNKTLATEIPVMFRNVIYHNTYCAVCNNPGDNLTDMTTAGAACNCLNTTGTSSYYRQLYDPDSRCDQAVSKCVIMYNLSNFYNLRQYRPRYICRMEGNTQSVCDSNLTDPQFDFDYLQSTCQKYRARIYHSPSDTYYNNPHCAMCSGLLDPNDMTCFHLSMERKVMVSFKRIIVSTPLFKIQPLCVADRVFDHEAGVCITSTCPFGHVRLRDERCASLNVTVPQILSAKRDFRIYVVISTENKKLGHVDLGHVIKDIGVNVVLNSTRRKACSAVKVWNNWDLLYLFKAISNTSTCWILETLSRSFDDIVGKVELFVGKVDIGDELLSFNISMQIDLFVFKQDGNITSGICLNGSPKIRRDLIFQNDSKFQYPSTFQVVSTEQMYYLTETPLIIPWRLNHLTNAEWNESTTALVCEPDIFSCDTVTFQADEYIDMGESLKLYGGTSQEVKIHERNVLRLESNAIVMCASLLSNLTGILGMNNDGNETDILVQGILTLVGNIVSMACLVFTMTTYCMFEKIRTRPGKCVMNLCVALFFAQLSFQVSDTFLSYREACAAVAAFQHYTWLVAFLWMNVLAFDISCAFSDLVSSYGVRDKTRIRVFSVYGWGLPAVFVAVCLVLDFGTKLPFSYGSETMCWIAGPRAIAYYFATPVAVVITANTVLFVRTVVALRRAMSTASIARKPVQKKRSAFVIYLRLTSLMGFTWLFGFLANIDVLSFLSYPFILCNTCQGVFICASFALTPTVRKLWKDMRSSNQRSNTNEEYPLCRHPPHAATPVCKALQARN